MRISDWSSDVCSSDLVDAELRAAAAPHPDAAAVPAPVLALHAARLRQLPDAVDPAPDRDVAAALAAVVRLAAPRLPVVLVAGTVAAAGTIVATAARKSVASGKGVHVRVEHGGRRIIQKKMRN